MINIVARDYLRISYDIAVLIDVYRAKLVEKALNSHQNLIFVN